MSISILDRTEKLNLNEMSTDQYREYKIALLERDFCVKLTKEHIDHFNSLTSDGDIERYFNMLLNQKLH